MPLRGSHLFVYGAGPISVGKQCMFNMQRSARDNCIFRIGSQNLRLEVSEVMLSSWHCLWAGSWRNGNQREGSVTKCIQSAWRMTARDCRMERVIIMTSTALHYMCIETMNEETREIRTADVQTFIAEA